VATLQRMSPERVWWRNIWRVLWSPHSVFTELRASDDDDSDEDGASARQEPVLLVVILAGIAGVLATPTAGRLLDSDDFDWLLVAVWAFVGGLVYGFVVYMLGGLALWLGTRGMGADGDWRLARHVLAYSAVPVALSLFVVLPTRLIAFGGDTFRAGGADSSGGEATLLGLQLAFVVWTVVLLVLGVAVVHGFSPARSLATLGIVALVVAAIVSLPSSL
jgi:hypothetical protein